MVKCEVILKKSLYEMNMRTESIANNDFMLLCRNNLIR